uniref:FBD domain-containing protein n=1 Tax=Arundo donax TaxID=35708 RepID=A0A0A9F3J8_ARUDO
MPLLGSAFVRLQTGVDCCDNKYETGDCNSCEGCLYSNIGSNTSVLLESLSGATNLELTSAQTEFIFRKDLTCCPVFGKLKTLLLNEWCITANLGALICFLQHSPILEKLILQFPEGNQELVETRASYATTKETFTLKQLTVDVRCHKVDEGIQRILDLLGSYGVPSEQIKIQEPPELIELEDDDDDGAWPSTRFSFEQRRHSLAVQEATFS